MPSADALLKTVEDYDKMEIKYLQVRIDSCFRVVFFPFASVSFAVEDMHARAFGVLGCPLGT